MIKDILDFFEKVTMEAEVVQEELAHSYEVVKKLLPFMAKRGIPVSPKNFRLFYDYMTFANPDINKTVNQLLERDIKFHSRISDGLHAFFYAEEVTEQHARAISEAAKSFISVSDNMTESIINVQGQHDRFHEVLSNSRRQIADIDPVGPIQPYLEDLLKETKQALAATDTFSCRLKEANEIIAVLKEDLQTKTEMAMTDELTKLSNRHHLKLEAPRLIREAVEKGQPLSAILFDIDLFKNVNDTWGHDKGDKVLRICADIIIKAGRGSDLAVRLGGEEFLLLCPNIDLITAAKVAERVRQSVASTKIPIQKGQSLSITVSGGVAEYVPGEEMSAFIARADAALYQAKAAGRNCVRIAGIASDL